MTFKLAGAPAEDWRKEGSRRGRNPQTPSMSQLEDDREARQLTLGDSWGKEGWLGRSRCPGPGTVSCVRVQLAQGIASPVSSCRPSLRARLWLGANGAHHHASGAQRVAGSLEVVPADAVELAQVAASWVVDAIQV